MKKIIIPEELYHYFEEAGSLKNYHKNDIIYMQDDNATDLYLIKKGRVRVYYISRDGNEATLEIVEKGRIFGESSFIQKSKRPTTVSAINEVELICCSLEDLYAYLCESEELTILLFQLLSNTCNHLSGLLNQAYFYNRYEKVAYFLLQQTVMADKDKDICENCIPYSHEEIALCVGLNRVTTTKVLNYFSNLGYIELKYKKVIILNKPALARYIGLSIL
ncbi:Crp/Fnr family transcriptional regulator [Desulfitobacterium sp.]|uniref:Crp/Fnr family transcriptional regulator n=1 Tax=Desulfitobacterium sp. TaxID=49981 RepID=UPI002B1EA82F|nr:Crp/Fnr family transcriptional regulator [Desulfitobacterium sp.]MEA4902577.1 Crp/Fnr family transcriptional regulator [Desulfitobacterium sp.]